MAVLSLGFNLPIDDIDPLFLYTGQWQPQTGGSTRQWGGGTTHATSENGASVFFVFQGQAFVLYATIPAGKGNVHIQVVIDGGSPQEAIQASGEDDVFQDALYQSPVMNEGIHTALIINRGGSQDSFLFDNVVLLSDFLVPGGVANFPSSYPSPTSVPPSHTSPTTQSTTPAPTTLLGPGNSNPSSSGNTTPSSVEQHAITPTSSEIRAISTETVLLGLTVSEGPITTSAFTSNGGISTSASVLSAPSSAVETIVNTDPKGVATTLIIVIQEQPTPSSQAVPSSSGSSETGVINGLANNGVSHQKVVSNNVLAGILSGVAFLITFTSCFLILCRRRRRQQRARKQCETCTQDEDKLFPMDSRQTISSTTPTPFRLSSVRFSRPDSHTDSIDTCSVCGDGVENNRLSTSGKFGNHQRHHARRSNHHMPARLHIVPGIISPVVSGNSSPHVGFSPASHSTVFTHSPLFHRRASSVISIAITPQHHVARVSWSSGYVVTAQEPVADAPPPAYQSDLACGAPNASSSARTARPAETRNILPTHRTLSTVDQSPISPHPDTRGYRVY